MSATLHVYVNQTDRGELVIGAEIDPYASYSNRSTLPFLENSAAHVLELLPSIAGRQGAAPVGGHLRHDARLQPHHRAPCPTSTGFILDVGWGTYGFKAGPVAGRRIAELIATGHDRRR